MTNPFSSPKKCPVCKAEIVGMRSSRKVYCSKQHKDLASNSTKDWKAVNDKRKQYLADYRAKAKRDKLSQAEIEESLCCKCCGTEVCSKAVIL